MNGLFILYSDNVNLSLINLYNRMIDSGFEIHCLPLKKDSLSLHAFEKSSVRWENNYQTGMLDQFDFVICGRNCFGVLPPEDLIDYKGIIYTDDTAFYEGRNVYGDVVFVNGDCNLSNIKIFDWIKYYYVGCLKADVSISVSNSLWPSKSKYSQKVLFIESGHFPFGNRGRKELAESVVQTVQYNKDYYFIVKPRFLIGEASEASHRNEDYLFYYVDELFNGKWPNNIVWLDKYYSLEELIPGADIILHTYSSAHSEAVLQKKKIINIYDIASEETADFRVNRLGVIKSIIDCCESDVSAKDLPYFIREAKSAPDFYYNYIGGNYKTSANIIVDFILKHENVVNASIRKNRIKGFLYSQLSILENRFDDYNYFLRNMKKYDAILEAEKLDTMEAVNAILKIKIDLAHQYIIENWETICSNRFNRAYSLRILFECHDKWRFHKMLLEGYSHGDFDTAYYYFKAVETYREDQKLARAYAEKYISLRQQEKFECLDSDNNEYYIKMLEILGK